MSGDAAVPYGALFDALGRTLSGNNERAVLLLYALLHGCSQFHEYCLVGVLPAPPARVPALLCVLWRIG